MDAVFNGSAKATGDRSYWPFVLLANPLAAKHGTQAFTACPPGLPWSEVDLGHDRLERRPNSAVVAMMVAFEGRLVKVGDDPTRRLPQRRADLDAFYFRRSPCQGSPTLNLTEHDSFTLQYIL